MEPLSVSVVIPTYNRAALVCRAITSALAAMQPEDEVVVVDDGSTDDTAARVGAFCDQVRYLRIPHGGVGAARNCGVRAARHPLIALLDSDDEWMPDKLAIQRAVLQHHPELTFCFSDFFHRDEQGKEQGSYLREWHHDPRSWDEILGPGEWFSTFAPLPTGRADFRVHVGSLYRAMLRADYVFTTTVMLNRARCGTDLRFPEHLTLYEDQECFGRLARRGPIAYLACETAWNIAHHGPRVSHGDTAGDTLWLATARLVLIQRVWGADASFLARYGDEFRQEMERQHLLKARGLLRLGRTREARAALRFAGKAPWSHRFLAACPGMLTRRLSAVGRSLQARRSRWMKPRR